MKIAVNAQFLNKPGTGTGQYFIRLLETLLEIDKENTYVLYSEALNPSSLSLMKKRMNVRILNTPFYTRDDLIRKTIWEKFIFPKAVKKDKVDLVWSPYFSVSRFRGIRHVMTIHDVIYCIFPHYIPNIRWKIYYKLAEHAARYADKILTISECSKKDIMKFLRIQEEKVKVVYLGRPKIPLNPPLRKGESDDFSSEKWGNPTSLFQFSELKLKNNSSLKNTNSDSSFEKGSRGILENKKYILYLGGFDYRKNVVTLLHAYKKFLESHPDIYLVIIGKIPEYTNSLVPDLKSAVSQLGVDHQVIFPGFILNNDLPAYYAHAEMFVFPSLYEGFGLTVLEAMTYGCPVVTSENSSLPEVAGDAAILIDSSNADNIVDAMAKIAGDRELREILIQKGLENSKRFSWEKCARETLEVFNNQ